MTNLYWVFLLVPVFSFAQDQPSTTDPAQLIQSSENAYRAQSYGEARALAQQAYDLLNPTAAPLLWPKAAYQLGRSAFALQVYDTAQIHFLEAARAPQYPLLEQGNAWHYAGRCAWETRQFTDAEAHFTQALLLRLQLDTPCDVAESYAQLGDLRHARGHYGAAVEDLTKAVDAQQRCSGPESAELANLRLSLGISCMRKGDYGAAQLHFEACLAIQNKVLPPNHLHFAATYYRLGVLYRTLYQHEEAFYYYQKSLEVKKAHYGSGHIELAENYDQIGSYYLAQGEPAKAMTYFNEMNDIMVAHNATHSSAYAFACASMGQACLALKDNAQAVDWFDRMVIIWRDNNRYLNSQLASMLTYLGLAKMRNKQFDAGLADYMEAVGIWEQLHSSYLPKGYALVGAAHKTEYWQSPSDHLIRQARGWYIKADSVMAQQIANEESPEALRKTLTELYSSVDNAIETEFLYLQRFPDDRAACLERIWHYHEQMHGYQLLAAMQEAKATQYAGVPNAEREQVAALRTHIATLEKERTQALLGGADLDAPSILAKNTFILNKKAELNSLLANFEKKYPKFYNQRFNRQLATIQQVQAQLQPDQCLLSYFVGDSSVYILVVKPDGATIEEVRRQFPLAQWAQDLRQGLEGYYTAASPNAALYQRSVEQYAQAAQQLYGKLVAPVAHLLAPNVVVLPDGLLNDLPFDALLSGPPTDLSNFGTYPFLVHRYAVSYAYSGTTWLQVSAAKAIDSGKMLAIAPFFSGDTAAVATRMADGSVRRDEVLPLPFSGEEVVRIKKVYPASTDLLTGAQATKSAFCAQAAQYGVLHLSTHGVAHLRDGAYSHLLFAKDQQSDGVLTAGELYQLDLAAQMVVLSACETGSVQKLQGEGVIGLVRAFTYAGAKSVVASLWKVSDRATMQVMALFYEQLATGTPKNTALAQAKRAYLKQYPGRSAHPYFWSAFSVYGDVGRVNF